MFRIGEFSKLTQVSIRMLRYYDEVNLLKPAYIDQDTKYRLYATEQIPILNKIIYLRDSGFQVAEIANALDCKNHEVMEQLDLKYKEIELNIKEEQEKLNKIEVARKEIMQGKEDFHYQIAIKSIPSYRVLSLRRTIPTYYAECDLWEEMKHFAQEHTLDIGGASYSIYHDEDYREEDVDVELCVLVDKFGQDEGAFSFYESKPIEFMASTMVYGDFSNIAKAYLAFAKWLQEQPQYKMLPISRQIVHRGPWNEKDPKKYLIEMQIPIEKNNKIKVA